MPVTEAYKEHIIYTFHAFCKVVIRNAAILSLPERRKEIIYLYYFERHTQQEIGEMYGRCRSTTGYQIRKTLRQLPLCVLAGSEHLASQAIHFRQV